jgi:hypothetical protein
MTGNASAAVVPASCLTRAIVLRNAPFGKTSCVGENCVYTYG